MVSSTKKTTSDYISKLHDGFSGAWLVVQPHIGFAPDLLKITLILKIILVETLGAHSFHEVTEE